ncbi:hypothetical protein WA026_014663 [Henosepilachna vigintioctopunctata]|uniref:Uncharacterized protein n=1 Tax=Henosepilachna vigintioctopunctata TaxID=420089 RepID=A0AAW1VE42_9CUCU
MDHRGTDLPGGRRGSLQAGLRSVSEGGKKAERQRNTTREGSGGSVTSLDVRCGCQYFQCDSLLPEKGYQGKNSRPTSRLSNNSSLKTSLFVHENTNNTVRFNLDNLDTSIGPNRLPGNNVNNRNMMNNICFLHCSVVKSSREMWGWPK